MSAGSAVPEGGDESIGSAEKPDVAKSTSNAQGIAAITTTSISKQKARLIGARLQKCMDLEDGRVKLVRFAVKPRPGHALDSQLDAS
jgi:hypothetical protein